MRWARGIWRMPAVEPPRIPLARDLVLVGAVGAVAVTEALLRPDLPWAAIHVLAVVGAAPLLLGRRRYPLLMLALATIPTTLTVILAGSGSPLISTAAFLLLPYALVRWGAGRSIVAGLALLVAEQVILAATGYATAGDAIGGIVVVAALAAISAAVRLRAAARARELELAAVREREHLARELHDTVAHHVSTIAVRANAGLATAATTPENATDALRLISVEASRTLDEMRAIVRLLRNDREESHPPATLEQLRGLEVGRDGGPAVGVEITGAEAQVDEVVASAVFRIAQESVTNARRHARGASLVEVRVDVGPERVHVRVTDDGVTDSATEAGYGLTGMRERAALLGGAVAAGPADGGGWMVEADLPTRITS